MHSRKGGEKLADKFPMKCYLWCCRTAGVYSACCSKNQGLDNITTPDVSTNCRTGVTLLQKSAPALYVNDITWNPILLILEITSTLRREDKRYQL